jgi:hypothetical protein
MVQLGQLLLLAATSSKGSWSSETAKHVSPRYSGERDKGARGTCRDSEGQLEQALDGKKPPTHGVHKQRSEELGMFLPRGSIEVHWASQLCATRAKARKLMSRRDALHLAILSQYGRQPPDGDRRRRRVRRSRDRSRRSQSFWQSRRHNGCFAGAPSWNRLRVMLSADAQERPKCA